MHDARRYLATLLASTTLMLGAVAAFNVAVDPYDVYGFVRVFGINAEKPAQHGRDRMVKAHAIDVGRADGLLLGTSRTQFGVDPDNRWLAQRCRRPFNAGLLDADVVTAYETLQHAQAVAPLRIVILGLDPLMFDLHRDGASSTANSSRKQTSARAPLSDAVPTLLSWDAVRMSFATLRHQRDTVSELLPSGLRNPETLQAQIDAAGGPRALFMQRARDYLASFANYTAFEADGSSKQLEALADILAFSRTHGIDLRLYLSPSHALMNDVIHLARKDREVERLKRALVDLIDEAQQHHPESPLALWDFSDANPLTCEAVPEAHATRGMAGFWEVSHFKTAVGAQVLRRILTGEADLPTFGVALAPHNIDRELTRMRASQHAYEASVPADVDEIAGLVSEDTHEVAGLFRGATRKPSRVSR